MISDTTNARVKSLASDATTLWTYANGEKSREFAKKTTGSDFAGSIAKWGTIALEAVGSGYLISKVWHSFFGKKVTPEEFKTNMLSYVLNPETVLALESAENFDSVADYIGMLGMKRVNSKNYLLSAAGHSNIQASEYIRAAQGDNIYTPDVAVAIIEKYKDSTIGQLLGLSGLNLDNPGDNYSNLYELGNARLFDFLAYFISSISDTESAVFNPSKLTSRTNTKLM